MAKRHRDALAIQRGACNPNGIVNSLALKKISAEPNFRGTRDLTGDPAVRLMVHQLAYITGIGDLTHTEHYTDIRECARLSEEVPA